MRCRTFCTVPSAPSAICATLMPSCELLTAWVMPLIWLVRPWLIDRPAASSAALLIRRPDESWVNASDSLAWFMFRLLYALSAATLVLIRRLILFASQTESQGAPDWASDPSLGRTSV